MSKVTVTMEEINRLFWIHTIRGCFAEFLAVAIFVFIGSLGGGLASPYVGSVAAALAHGLTITVLIITFGHISGGHVNPAVTLGVCLSGGIHWLKAILYFFFQLLGGFVGALFVRAVTKKEVYNCIVVGGITTPSPEASWGEALAAEALITYILVQAVLLAAVDFQGQNNLAPFGIGLALLVDILAAANISGASANPARSLGPAAAYSIFVGTYHNCVEPYRGSHEPWKYHYIYWAGPLIGAVVAAVFYRLILGNNEKRLLFKLL